MHRWQIPDFAGSQIPFDNSIEMNNWHEGEAVREKE